MPSTRTNAERTPPDIVEWAERFQKRIHESRLAVIQARVFLGQSQADFLGSGPCSEFLDATRELHEFLRFVRQELQEHGVERSSNLAQQDWNELAFFVNPMLWRVRKARDEVRPLVRAFIAFRELQAEADKYVRYEDRVNDPEFQKSIDEGRLDPSATPTLKYDEGIMEALGFGLSAGIDVREIDDPERAVSYLRQAADRAAERVEQTASREWLYYRDPVSLSYFADPNPNEDDSSALEMLVEFDLESVPKSAAEIRALDRIANWKNYTREIGRDAFEAEGLSRLDFKNFQERAKRKRQR